MDFAITTRAAVGRTRWKGIFVVICRAPTNLRGYSYRLEFVFSRVYKQFRDGRGNCFPIPYKTDADSVGNLISF